MILHGFFFIALVGILLTLLGITRLCLLGYDNEIIHWLFGDTKLLSGLAFLLTGITFIITASKQHKLKNSVQYFSGIAIVILSCTFYLIKERIFNYENIYLYIYEYGNTVQLSPAAFFCLSLLGLSLLLLPLGNRKSVGILLQVLAIVILIFALIAFCGYALKLGLLYNEYQYLTIPIISIFGLMLASCGLWNIYWKNKWFHNLYKGREDQKVMMTIAMISVCVISLSGFATYKTLSYENEKVIQQEFKNYLLVYKKQF
ncbi:MAG TPA: hypothetical protein VFP93_00270, partial [Gammaproteobacteria bacterium]|nr:hypothetical protein [Gammaproteobacteria bacterium]